ASKPYTAAIAKTSAAPTRGWRGVTACSSPAVAITTAPISPTCAWCAAKATSRCLTSCWRKLSGAPRPAARRREVIDMQDNPNIEALVSQINDVILSRLGAGSAAECAVYHDECFVKCPDRMQSLIDGGVARFGLAGLEI